MDSIVARIRIMYETEAEIYPSTTSYEELKVISHSKDNETQIEIGSTIYHDNRELKVVDIKTIVSKETHHRSDIGGVDVVSFEKGILVNDGSYNIEIYYIVE